MILSPNDEKTFRYFSHNGMENEPSDMMEVIELSLKIIKFAWTLLEIFYRFHLLARLAMLEQV